MSAQSSFVIDSLIGENHREDYVWFRVRPIANVIMFRAFGRSEKSPFADHGDTFLFEIGQTPTDGLGVGNLQE